MERQRRKDPSKNLVECLVGDVHYGVAIGAVREIVNPLPLVQLPNAPAAVIGVADYRDDVVPVVDMRLRFGLMPMQDTRRTKWIIVQGAGQLFAMVVDAVTEVFRSAEIRPAPVVGGADTRGIEGVASREGGLVFILDVDKLSSLVSIPAVEPSGHELGDRS